MSAHPLPPIKAIREGMPEIASLRQSASKVIAIECAAISALTSRIDAAFFAACELMLACRGRVVVTGMGKSGHIASKIAATLASTGTPSFFVHPGEASHGDLGMITADDQVLAISNSGETDEILTIMPVLKRLGVPLIAMTGRRSSTLARLSEVHIDVSVSEEACPLGLAPTASTTASLVMGDALAITLLEARGFTAEDFGRSHPAGQLGRRLLLRVSDIMHRDSEIPRVGASASVSDALVEMTRKGLGMTAITDEQGIMLGVFTDGDLRRTIDDDDIDMRTTPVTAVMTRGAKSIGSERLAAEAARLMEDHTIHSLLVVDEAQRVVGALNIHDLLRARVL